MPGVPLFSDLYTSYGQTPVLGGTPSKPSDDQGLTDEEKKYRSQADAARQQADNLGYMTNEDRQQIAMDRGMGVQSRGEQQSATGLLRAAAEGNAPSQAEMQMHAGVDQATAEQAALAAGARGGPQAMAAAQRSAAMQGAAMQGQGIQQAGALRAQEMAQARGQYAQAAASQRAADLQAQGLDADTALKQAQLETQGYAVGQQAALGYEGLTEGERQANMNALLQTNATNAGIGISNAQQSGNMMGGVVGAGLGLAAMAAMSDVTAKTDISPAGKDSIAFPEDYHEAFGQPATPDQPSDHSFGRMLMGAQKGWSGGFGGLSMVSDARAKEHAFAAGKSHGRDEATAAFMRHAFERVDAPRPAPPRMPVVAPFMQRAMDTANAGGPPPGPGPYVGPARPAAPAMAVAPTAPAPVQGSPLLASDERLKSKIGPMQVDDLVSDANAKEQARAEGRQQGMTMAAQQNPMMGKTGQGPQPVMGPATETLGMSHGGFLAGPRQMSTQQAQVGMGMQGPPNLGNVQMPQGPPNLPMRPAFTPPGVGGMAAPGMPIAGGPMPGPVTQAPAPALAQPPGPAMPMQPPAPRAPMGAASTFLSDKRQKEGVEHTAADGFLDHLHPYTYEYKQPGIDGEGRRLGIMAQDVERSPTGDTIVKETPRGKAIEGGPALSAALAGLGRLHERVTRLERGR